MPRTAKARPSCRGGFAVGSRVARRLACHTGCRGFPGFFGSPEIPRRPNSAVRAAVLRASACACSACPFLFRRHFRLPAAPQAPRPVLPPARWPAARKSPRFPPRWRAMPRRPRRPARALSAWAERRRRVAAPWSRSRSPDSDRSGRQSRDPRGRRALFRSWCTDADRDRRSCRARRARAGRRACPSRFPCSLNGGRGAPHPAACSTGRSSAGTFATVPWAPACRRCRHRAGRSATTSRCSCSPRSGSAPRGPVACRIRPGRYRTCGGAARWACRPRTPQSDRRPSRSICANNR